MLTNLALPDRRKLNVEWERKRERKEKDEKVENKGKIKHEIKKLRKRQD